MALRASGTVTFLVTVKYDNIMISDDDLDIGDGIEPPDWIDGRSITATFPGAFSISDIEMHHIEDEEYVDIEEEARREEDKRLAEEHESNRIEVESQYV